MIVWSNSSADFDQGHFGFATEVKNASATVSGPASDDFDYRRIARDCSEALFA
jgi:hypothetical protein